MTKWIPEWLASSYQRIVKNFWLSPFTITQAEKVGIPRPRVVLPRLTASGWLERVGRGEYRAVHPLIAVLESFEADWRSKIQQRAYLPLIELVLARLIDGLGESLRSALLYGSVARGEAEKDSDIDLLVVADNLPNRYGDRVRLILDLIRGWEDVKASLSKRYGINPNPDIIILDSLEVDPAQPFFLDLAFEGIVLYDRDDFISSRLESLRRELLEDLPGLDKGEDVVIGDVINLPAIISVRKRRSLEGGGDIDVDALLDEAAKQSGREEEDALRRRGDWEEVRRRLVGE